MTQLAIGVSALNHDSAFQANYEKGMKKTEYWTHTLEDCLSLIARLPALAARIYRNVYKPGTPIAGINKDLDLVGESFNRHQSHKSYNLDCSVKATIPTCLVTATMPTLLSIFVCTLPSTVITKVEMHPLMQPVSPHSSDW